MTDILKHPQSDDRKESCFPLRLKPKPDPSAPKPRQAPRDLEFVANAKNFMDLAPLMRVFEKYSHIRDAVITALRDEGRRS